MIPVQVSINKNDIIFRTGDENVVYKSSVNGFLENTGLTIQNIMLPMKSEKVFYFPLIEIGQTFTCGTSLTNALLRLEQESENGLVIIDFNEVTEVSQGFLKAYLTFLLETSNKVITINMNTSISSIFSTYIINNVLTEEEE